MSPRRMRADRQRQQGSKAVGEIENLVGRSPKCRTGALGVSVRFEVRRPWLLCANSSQWIEDSDTSPWNSNILPD